MDPARVTTLARRVATRIAADQVAAAAAKNKRDRYVQVSPGPDGTADWWARLPAARSAAAWAAINDLADQYASKDPDLTLDQARADAFIDLLLTNVTITTKLTLGIPILTGPDADTARNAALTAHDHDHENLAGQGHRPGATHQVGHGETVGTQATVTDPASGATTAPTDTIPAAADDTTSATCTAPASSDPGTGWVRPAVGTGGLGSGAKFSLSAALISGCEVPGIGFIDAATIETLLTIVPTDIGRALLDARTGTLIESVTTAYRPPKPLTDFVTTRDGTCRMWGCPRPARRCDLDHARPWPNGPTSPTNLAGLCRRHHRLKQRRRWTYHLDPDGTATWTSPTGKERITHPDHALLPPPPAPAEPITCTAELVADDPPPF